MKKPLIYMVGALLLGASIAYALSFHRTTIHYVFRNGITVENTLDLPASGVDFAEQSFLTVGAAPAATCTAGSLHVDTDETDDTNCATVADNSICVCSATDTWVEAGN